MFPEQFYGKIALQINTFYSVYYTITIRVHLRKADFLLQVYPTVSNFVRFILLTYLVESAEQILYSRTCQKIVFRKWTFF